MSQKYTELFNQWYEDQGYILQNDEEEPEFKSDLNEAFEAGLLIGLGEHPDYTCSELSKRILSAKREFEQYPEWVKQNSVFQGGGERRGEREDFESYGNY